MVERKKANLLLEFLHPLQFGRLMPIKNHSIPLCTWNVAEGRCVLNNVDQLLISAPGSHSNADLKEIFIPDVFVLSTHACWRS